MYAANAMLSQLQRHPGAGRFVGSGTEQDNLAIAGDFAVPAFQFLGRNLQGAGQGPRVGQNIQRMPQVHDDHGLARFHLVFEFIGRNAVALDLVDEALTLTPAIDN